MRFQLDQFDRVILIDRDIYEAKNDTINYSGGGLDPRLKAVPGMFAPQDTIQYITTIGPGANLSFGSMIRNYMPKNNGWSSEVTDFGDAIIVKVSYNNMKTARTSSQTFLILFTTKAGVCKVKSNFAKWRTCGSVEQAASYIRSKSSALSGKTAGMS